MLGARWGMLAPQPVDEHITVNRLVGVQQQDRQQRPLLQAAQVDGGPVDGDFQRPQEAITDHFAPPRHSQPRPGACRQLAERRSGLRCELLVTSLA
jgi:hypothetical protein